jgi:hypothetical protein
LPLWTLGQKVESLENLFFLFLLDRMIGENFRGRFGGLRPPISYKRYADLWSFLLGWLRYYIQLVKKIWAEENFFIFQDIDLKFFVQ